MPFPGIFTLMFSRSANTMIKRKADDDSVKDSSVVKLYGAPPPLKDDLIRRLQGAVDAAPTEALCDAEALNELFLGC